MKMGRSLDRLDQRVPQRSWAQDMLKIARGDVLCHPVTPRNQQNHRMVRVQNVAELV